MKKFSVLLFLTLFSSFTFAASPNYWNLKVNNMRGDYDNEGGKYQYKFSCCSGWFISGDDNVNKVLQIAYLTGVSVNVGLNGNGNVVTVVETN